MRLSRILHVSRLLCERLVLEVQYLPVKMRAWFLNARSQNMHHDCVSEAKLREHCKGDTLFVLGSGGSLASLPSSTLEAMRQNTTISLNYSILQSFIPSDFHLVRELGVANDIEVNLPDKDLYQFGELAACNPCYKDTIYLVQGGYQAWSANTLIGKCCFAKGTKIFRFRNTLRPNRLQLGQSLQDISHGASSITDCINIGYLLGFKKIVLCGVDLYDRRYFWHVPGVSFMPLPGLTDSELGEYGGKGDMEARHRTADGLINRMGQWHNALKENGCELSIQNPKSLLANVLPLYDDQANK